MNTKYIIVPKTHDWIRLKLKELIILILKLFIIIHPNNKVYG